MTTNEELARAVYERGDDPTMLRAASGHEEFVCGGRTYCRVCGPIEGDTPDPVFHADHYYMPDLPSGEARALG